MTRRVVLDTNVYVSALRFGGKPKLVLDLVMDEGCRLLVSSPLRLELERILRDKFSYTAREIDATASFLWGEAEWIAPTHRLQLCPDEADNRVLECAVEGRAQFIVSGDKHLLNVPPIEGIAILKPDAFLGAFIRRPAAE